MGIPLTNSNICWDENNPLGFENAPIGAFFCNQFRFDKTFQVERSRDQIEKFRFSRPLDCARGDISLLYIAFLTYGFQYFLISLLFGEVNSTFNKCQMRIRLWEVTQQTFRFKIDILTEQSQMVAVAQ